MRRRRPKDVRLWLEQQPSLAELSDAFPIEWAAVKRELSEVLAKKDFEKFKAYVEKTSRGPKVGSKQGDDALLSAQIHQHLALAAIRRMCISAATNIKHGRIRFNLLNGYVAQKLLFKNDLVRKPVSMFWFRLIWPLLWQRNFLMLLVQPKGIYCFYSKPLIRKIAALVDGRPCLEIAAGDGTLSRFLRSEKVDVVATDDYSWAKSIQFPDDVVRQDARKALRERKPEVVVCSWPPAGNDFEREVFKMPSVKLYVVISSRHEFGTGDWTAYREQTEFDFAQDAKLSKLILPPEAEGAVYVFRRRMPTPESHLE